jgi:hypothetical protein
MSALIIARYVLLDLRGTNNFNLFEYSHKISKCHPFAKVLLFL